MLPEDPGRLDDDGTVHLEALDELDRYDGHLCVEAMTGRSPEWEARPLQGVLHLGGLGVGCDDGQVSSPHRLQLETDRLGQAIQARTAVARQPHETRRVTLGPDGTRRSQVRRSLGQHACRQVHEGARDPVADGQLMANRRPAVGKVHEDRVPVVVGPGTGGLGDVTDDGHGTVQGPPAEHSQVHRREVLHLVDHDVAVGTHGIGLALTRPGTQHGPGLVQEGGIRCRPQELVGLGDALPVERPYLGRGEARICGTDERLRTEEVVQELRRRQHRPHPFQGLPDGPLPVDAFLHGPGIQVATATGRQRHEELGLHELAGCVVGPVAAPRLVHDQLRLRRREAQPLEPVSDPQVVAERPLAGTGGTGHEPDHAQVALQPAHLGNLAAIVHPDATDDVAQRRQHHAGLAE